MALILFEADSFGQVVSYVSSLQPIGTEINVAEISLIHRSRVNYKDITDPATRLVLLLPKYDVFKFLQINMLFPTFSIYHQKWKICFQNSLELLLEN